MKGCLMCESNAYIVKDGEEQLLMENVSYVKPQPDGVLLKSIFGDQTVVNATIREMDLTGHRIVLDKM